MASTQLCIQQKSFLLAGSFNRACVDTRTNLLPPNQRCANRTAKHGVTRAALAAASPSTEGSVKSSLEGLLQEARLQKGRASMRAWWYYQHVQKAEKEAESADSTYAQAGDSARQMEMEEGRAVMRIWWLDRQLRALDPSRPPLPPVKRTRRVHPVRRNPSLGPKQATTVAEGEAVSSGRWEEPVTASEEHPAPSEVKTITTDTTKAQEAATPLDDPVSVDAQAERQRKMDVGRVNMRNWWTQEQEASKRAVEGTVSEKRPALSESKTNTTNTTGAQEPAAPPDNLMRIEMGKGEETAQAQQQKEMDARRAKMREWWIQEQEATKRSLGVQGTESKSKTITTDTTRAEEAVTPLDDPVSVDAQAERQRKMDVGRVNMRNWWTQEQEVSKRAVEGTVSEKRPALSESKTITTDTTGPQEPPAPPDNLISIKVGKGEEAAQAERQKGMDARRAKMREWWIQEQEATKRKFELQEAESEKLSAASEVKATITDTTRAQERVTPVDDLVSTEVRKEQDASQTERQRKMDAGRAKMREWWTQQMQATKNAPETEAITMDATGAQELGTPADDPVSIDVQKEQDAAQNVSLEAQAEQQRRMDGGRANMRKWWIEEQEATKRKLEVQEAESEKLSAASEVKAIATDTTRAQELAAPPDDLPSTEVQKEQDAAQAERQTKIDAGRAKMRNWWIEEQEATKRKLELRGAESEKRPAPSEVKTITTDTTVAQEVAAPKVEPVSVEVQAERQKKMDAGRARLREWWIKEKEATKPAPEPQGTESDKRPAPSESKTVTADTTGAQEVAAPEDELVSVEAQADKRPAPSEPKTVTAATTGAQKLPSPLDILVKIAVRKELEAAQRRALEKQAERQRTMDAGRAKMRKWWIKEREATKRALGLAPYGPVWTLVRNDGKEPPISIGKTPLIIGAEVGGMEDMIPVILDYPTVSGVHAKIFAKEVLSYGEYVRAYFVVDLKSTNGVRRNNNFRLRPGTQYKLSNGDTLCFGEEAATIVIKNPQKSP